MARYAALVGLLFSFVIAGCSLLFPFNEVPDIDNLPANVSDVKFYYIVQEELRIFPHDEHVLGIYVRERQASNNGESILEFVGYSTLKTGERREIVIDEIVPAEINRFNYRWLAARYIRKLKLFIEIKQQETKQGTLIKSEDVVRLDDLERRDFEIATALYIIALRVLWKQPELNNASLTWSPFRIDGQIAIVFLVEHIVRGREENSYLVETISIDRLRNMSDNDLYNKAADFAQRTIEFSENYP